MRFGKNHLIIFNSIIKDDYIMLFHRFSLVRYPLVLVIGLFLISTEMGKTQAVSPVISNLMADLSELVRPSGSNVYFVHLTFDYRDDDGDINTLLLTTVDPEKSTKTDTIFAITGLGIKERAGKGHCQLAYTANHQLGGYEYRLQLLDESGNKSQEASVSINLLKRGALLLEISKLTPSSGKPGDIIVMSGSGFNSFSVQANAVSMGGIAAEVKEVGPSKIAFVLPDNAVTSPVTVSNTRGVAFSANVLEVKPSIQIFGEGQRILTPLQKAKFTARVSGLADKSVQWCVNDIQGGSSTIGTIDKAGIYTAPAVPPSSGNIKISAVANARSSLSVTRQVQLCPVLPITGPSIVNTQTGGYVKSEDGLLTLSIPPAILGNDLSITMLKAEFIHSKKEVPGLPTEALPVAKFEIRVANETKRLLKPVKFSFLMPMWTRPGTKFKVLFYDGSKYVDEGLQAKVDDDGLLLNGNLWRVDTHAVIVGSLKRVSPPIQIPGPEVNNIRVPLGIEEEGLTLPVLLEGERLHRVDASGYLRISAADPALNAPNGPLEFGPVFVSQDGTQLGFTLRIKPIETLQSGQNLPVSFRIDGLLFGPVITDPNMFIIRGLPELIVHQDLTSNLYSIDGTRVDRVINDPGRYSTLVIDNDAVLGIGSEVRNIMADGLTWNLSTVIGFENAFGRLSWITDAQRLTNNVRIFQPANRLVPVDVTGPVNIKGTIYLAGMHGGENPRLDDPIGPGHRRLGGLASGTLSGGVGGDGGVTDQNNMTHDGRRAGNNSTPDLGVGRGANGRLLQIVQPAGFGSRFDPVNVEYSSYFGLVTNVAGWLISPPATVFSKLSTLASFAGSIISVASSTTNLTSGLIVSGQGGHGGFRPTNGVPTMDERSFTTSPGSGGGGGGGGGSSSYTETLFGITLHADQKIGGGGAGGGGAAGALRITTSSQFNIDFTGRFDGMGGRGGFGEPHRSLGSPSGGGGGGAGAVVKLQSPQLINHGVIDISGGERSGALLAQSGFPSPSNGCRIQILPASQKGELLCYGDYRPGIYPPVVKALWPTGRLRAEIPIPLQFIRGIGTAENIPFLFLGPISYLLILTSDNRVVFASSPDYLSGNPQIYSLGEYFDFSYHATGDLRLRGFIPTDVAQSPFPPHHVFVSGTDASGHVSQVHEFDLGGNYLGIRFSRPTAYFEPLRDIDFLSDGRLAGLMTVYTSSSSWEQGIHAIDLSRGSSSLIIDMGAYLYYDPASMSVLRGDQQDLIYLSRRVYTIGSCCPTIERYNLSGQKTTQMAFALETISSPGEPGLLRLDGSLPGSSVPKIAFDFFELPDLKYNNQPATFNSPTIGSFSGPASSVTGLESLVFGQSQLTLYCQGGEPNNTAELRKMSDTNPVPSGPTTPPADNLGQFVTRTQLDPGFNTVWVETNVGGDTHELLKRHVLYIKDAIKFESRN